jgi:hypothetical protein
MKLGPMRLPLVGYIPFINKLLAHKAMKKLAEIHGPVTGFYMGPVQPFIWMFLNGGGGMADSKWRI